MKSPNKLDIVFSPKSVAVLGASRDAQTVGGSILDNLIRGGFKGPIYPVNPKASEIAGLKCTPSILQVPAQVDLAVVILKASWVPEALLQCVQKGISNFIIISAGFKEIGGEGVELERRLEEIIRENHLNVIGPNCLGVLNTDPSVLLNATFAQEMPVAGNIAFISQSGALCTAVLEYARQEQIGFSKVVSMGNKVDISEIDLLESLGNDPKTDVILLYLEHLTDGRKFIDLARQITGDHRKPILAIKSGRTPQGAKAASSHTGALAGADEVYDAIFAQAGVLRVDSVDELFDYARAFAAQPLPNGRRVAIVTNAGGPGIMTTDACVRYGLELARLDPQTVEAIRPHVPPTAALGNPIDVIGDARHDRYEAALAAVLKDPGVDSVLVLATPQAMTDLKEIAQVIAQAARGSSKPVIACFMGVSDLAQGIEILEKERVPHYRFPEAAVRVLAAMSRYAEWLVRPRTEIKHFSVDRPKAQAILQKARAEKQTALTQAESLELLSAYGFPIPSSAVARSAEEVVHSCERVGFPIAMKILSPDILHKVDVGGVRLNIQNSADAKTAYEEILKRVATHAPGARLEGVLIQQMVPPGTETILGLKRDKQFGPMIMFGLGGIYVEVFKDVTFRLAPVRELGVRHMVQEIRAHKILQGFRGQPPADSETIIDCLERLSQLAVDLEEVAELDINPLIVYPKGSGARVADARVLLSG